MPDIERTSTRLLFPLKSRVSRFWPRTFFTLFSMLLVSAFSNSVTAQTLVNGGEVNAAISVPGEVDFYSFSASAGDSVILRVTDTGDTDFVPSFSVYKTPGEEVLSGKNGLVAYDSANDLAEGGSFTVEVKDESFLGLYTGTYRIYFVKTPGASELGSLADSDYRSDTIDLGDLDTFTFTASAGDRVRTLMIDKTFGSLFPAVALFGPSGGQVAYGSSSNAAYVNTAALPQTGTYTLVLRSQTQSGASSANGSGDYDFYFKRIPGANELGALGADDSTSGVIDLGDIDSHTFSANAGDTILVSAADPVVSGDDFDPEFVLYSPSAANLGGDHAGLVAHRNYSAPETGTYTLVLQDRITNSGAAGGTASGSYTLYFAKIPGASSNGKLSGASTTEATLDRGELHTYTFDAAVGDALTVNIANTGGALIPELYLYLPDGSYYTVTNSSYTTGGSGLPESGTYTLVVRDRIGSSSSGATRSGSYNLSYSLPNNGPFDPSGAQGSIPAKEACNEGAICSSPSYVGNPINTAQGFKAQSENDFRAGRLVFTRIYRSDSNWTDRDLGSNWRHNWFRSLEFFDEGSVPNVQVIDGRGAMVQFADSGSGWSRIDPDHTASFESLYDGGSVLIGYRYTTLTDTSEYFDIDGRLTRVEYRGSEALDFNYNASEQLTSVIDEQGHTITFSYDGSGRIESMTTPDGVYTYSYDVNDNLVQVARPDSTNRSYHYEDSIHLNALTGITSGEGDRIATWGYDSEGRATSSARAGGVESYAVVYNGDDTVTVINPLGHQMTYTYVTYHGVRKITNVEYHASATTAARTVSYTYTTEGWMESMTDGEGNVTRYVRDARGLEISRTEAEGTAQQRIITTTWDSVFRLPDVVTEIGRTTDYNYDGFGRLIDVTVTGTGSAQSRTTIYSYHPNTVDGGGNLVLGRLATVNGPRTDVSDITSFTYDASLNLTRVTNALGHQNNYAFFDLAGRPLVSTDENGVFKILSYDGRGRLTSLNHNSRVTSYNYDDAGLLTLLSLPDGRSYTYGYDDAQRLTSIESVTGERTEYTLDGAGNRVTELMRNPLGEVTNLDERVFDALGRLRSDIDVINGVGAITAYTYDDNDNLKTVTDPYLVTSSYSYDALQRVVSFADAEAGNTGSGFNMLDQLTSVNAPNNANTVFTYNAFGDIVQETSPDRGTTIYGRDQAGNMTSRTDARGVTATYTYDSLNRMTSISYPDPAENVGFVYDTSPGGPIPCSNGIGRLCKVTDESGLTHFSYDPFGNVTHRVHTELGVDYTHEFEWDAGDQLVQITGSDGRVTEYTRDAERRISMVDVQVNGAFQTLVSDITYRPDGRETSALYGNGLIESRDFDVNGLQQGTVLGPYIPIDVLGDVAPVGALDNVVNFADYFVLLRIVMNYLEATPQQMVNGDVYPVGAPDGVINIQDLFRLQQMVAP